MRTLQEKYNAVLEGNFSKEQFRRDAVMQLPNVVSKFNSFEDMTNILKNRGMIAEAKKEEVTAYKKPEVDPIDLIAPDLLDDGIRAELEAAGIEGTPSEEEYAKAKEKAAKNLAKDPLHYKNAQTMPEMGEKMEKAKLHEETALDRAEDHASNKVQDKLGDIADTVAEKPASVAAAFRKKVLANPTHYAKMSAHELEKEFKKFKLEEASDEDAELEYQANMEFDKYAGQPDPEITERLDYDTLTRMEGLVSIKVVDNFIEASQTIIKDLEQEGFEQDEIYEFLVDRLRTQEPISSADVVKETQPRTNTTDYASTPEKREDGTYDISGMMREAEAANTLADILKNKGSLDHLKKIERLRLKLIDGPFLQKNPDWKDKAVKFISYDAREKLVIIDLNGTSAFAYPNELVIDTDTTNMSEDAKTQLKEAVKALIKKTLES